MNRFVAGLVLYIATAAWSQATEPLHLRAGPWMTLQRDGALRVAFELRPAATPAQLATLRLELPATSEAPAHVLPLSWTQHPLQRPHALEASVLATRFEPALSATYAGRELQLASADRILARIRCPDPPPAHAPVRILVCSPRRYPDSPLLHRLRERLGGPIQAVVLLGAHHLRTLGTGDWEHRIPLLVVATEPAGPACTALVGEAGLRRDSFAWGALGLPVIHDPEHSALAVARDTSATQVVLDPHGAWRIGIDDARRSRDFSKLIATCRRQRVPLILGGESGVGFVSDPLSLDLDNRLVAVPGGTRYCQLGTGHDAAYAVHDDIARCAEELTVGLRLIDGRLDAFAHTGPTTADWHLAWEPWPRFTRPLHPDNASHARIALQGWLDLGHRSVAAGRHLAWRDLDQLADLLQEGRAVRGLVQAIPQLGLTPIERDRFIQGPYPWPRRTGGEPPDHFGYSWPPAGLERASGWGVGDAPRLRERWIGEDEDAGAARLLGWLPLPELDALAQSAVEIRQLFATAAEADHRHLLIRLCAAEPLIAVHWLASQDAPDPLVVREAVLRFIAGRSAAIDSAVRRLIASSQDRDLVRAVVHRARSENSLPLLQILMRRLQAQADGDLPLDPEPLLQHRITATVFASPYLSPTPLRPLATALEQRVHPLARAPLERFFARHGRDRPVDR